MGVPGPAVKVKMTSEGLNGDLLDTPDAPAPDGAQERTQDNSSDDDDDDDSFSDEDSSSMDDSD